MNITARHRHRPPLPALLSNPRDKRQSNQHHYDATTGAIRMNGVSIAGGRNDKRGIDPQEEEVRLRHRVDNRRDPARPSARYGPNSAAQTPPQTRSRAKKSASFHTAPGTNGIPSLCVSSLYSSMYVSRLTMRPGIGHSLMPSLSTIHTCSAVNASSRRRNDKHVQREKAGERARRR